MQVLARLRIAGIGLQSTALRQLAEPTSIPAFASPCLLSAALVLPAGFLLGGLVVYGGDPGVGILLLPVGAASLVTGLAATARGVIRSA